MADAVNLYVERILFGYFGDEANQVHRMSLTLQLHLSKVTSLESDQAVLHHLAGYVGGNAGLMFDLAFPNNGHELFLHDSRAKSGKGNTGALADSDPQYEAVRRIEWQTAWTRILLGESAVDSPLR
jgi:hypothetical protein